MTYFTFPSNQNRLSEDLFLIVKFIFLLIPLQEARGLDAGPRLVQKLVGFGDHRTSNIVAKIAEEEVAHVAVGVYWFVLVCQKMGRVPCATFKGTRNSASGRLMIKPCTCSK